MEQLCYIHFKPYNHKTTEGYWLTNNNVKVLFSSQGGTIGKTHTGFYDLETQKFRMFSYSEQDWNTLFQEYIFHDKVTDRFYYLYILRILYSINISKFQPETFRRAIHKQISDYPAIQEWFIRDLYKYSSFSSYNRQELILPILNEFGYDFKVIQSRLLIDAMDIIDESHVYRSQGIFTQFRNIFQKIHQWKKENADYYLNKVQSNGSNNDIIQLILWLNDLRPMIETKIIEKYFYYLGINTRTLIIKKLFEEHKNKAYSIRLEFLDSLLNSKRKLLADYQSALFNLIPEVNLSLEILIDAIKSYVSRQSFLTINGVIDIAIQQSGIQKNNINLDTKRILDTCDGGLRINPKFNGFLSADYQAVVNERLTLENFKECITTAINRLRNIKDLSYDDIFYVESLINELNDKKENLPQLISFLKERFPENSWNIKDADEINKCLVPELIKIDKARFTFSSSIDVLSNNEEIRANIIKTLNEWTATNNQTEWIVPIQNKELINRILKVFYVRNTGEINQPFFTDWKEIYNNLKNNLPKPSDICYGYLSEKKHHIINKDFVWCKHQPCFRTAMGYKESWQNYKLVDMLYILGVNTIENKKCGFIANTEYNRFVDVMLKAQKIVDRLQCKDCGHILFPAKRNNGNDSNEYTYYHCENTQCKEYHHENYINHCFNCKDGIIDSRESKRCPNGLCICPDCLTCCSNDFFERMANKYLSSNRIIPRWLNNRLGKGHKDLNILFCPLCGTEFSNTLAECPSCHYKWKIISFRREI